MQLFKEDAHSFDLKHIFIGSIWLLHVSVVVANECALDVPPLISDSNDDDLHTLPLFIEADRIEAFGTGNVVYKGDVAAEQGLRFFSADSAALDKKTGEVHASGNIAFSDGRITVYRGKSLHALQQDAFIELTDSDYQLHGYPGRGHARTTTYDKNNLTLKDASFTTCAIRNPFWLLKAKKISVERDAVFGQAWHASLWIKNKPIFYFPYFNFPVQNKRQSGFLYPKYGQSTLNGYTVSVPFYWNLAENYDATLEPSWIEKRGLMQNIEFRYLPSTYNRGNLYTEYLDQDAALDNKKRWLFHWQHKGRFESLPLRTAVSFTRVAPKDYNYFNDFKPHVGTLNKNSLEQSFQVTWPERNWDTTLDVRTYQTLLPEALTPHMIAPRLTYRHFWQTDWFSARFYSELTHFEHKSERRPAYSGTRLHIEPEFYVPLWIQPQFSFDAQINFLWTHYNQKVPDDLDDEYRRLGLNDLKGETTRFLPQIGINQRWFLARQWDIAEKPYTQTLEPQITYFYTPYHVQNNIGIFDSTTLPQDYYSLFYGRRFAGLDRISDANKLTLGVTSSLLDDQTGQERIRIGAAQAFYLRTPRVTLFPSQNPRNNKQSFFSVEADAHFTPEWRAHLGWQFDTNAGKFQALNSSAEFHKELTQAQVNYRFVDRDAFSELDTSATQKDIHQLGVLLKHKINGNVEGIGAYYLDLNTGSPIERKLGLRYNACCWSASFIMQWQNIPDNISGEPRVNASYGLQFEFKGLGDVGVKAKEFSLDTALLPYTRPFNL